MKTTIRNMSMEDVFTLDSDSLQNYISKDFKAGKRKFVQTDDFLYYCGTFPVLLVAHMDTVHTHAPTVCKSSDGDIWMAPEGIGGDDRCGIWIILNILERFDCHVLFTQGEEIGGIGAKAFVASGLIPSVNYMIEIDRQGDDDAVFYSCGNKKFKDFITENTGYVESFGSFSDISILSPKFDLASVNLSSGYYAPHSNSEFIKLSDMDVTMQTVEYLLTVDDRNTVFKYERAKYIDTFDMAAYNKAYGYHGRASAYIPGGGWEDDDDDEYLPRVLPASTTPITPITPTKFARLEKLNDATTVYVPVKEEKSSFLSPDDETYRELEAQETEDRFDQMIYDETELYLTSITGYVVDEEVTNQVAMTVKDVLTDSAYLPTLF